jgi:hypothetical protein
MVTFSLEEMHVGDKVELEPPAPAAQAASAEPPVQSITVK